MGSPSSWLGAVWAWRAVREVRGALARDGMSGAVRTRPPRAAHAGRGIMAVLDHVHVTCLERALVLQCWLTDNGQPIDVVIGVRRDAPDGFAAHAWLDGDERTSAGYHELTRIGPVGGTP